jgi:hypothetical protein
LRQTVACRQLGKRANPDDLTEVLAWPNGIAVGIM